MPKESGTVKVKAIPGEVFRFYVESWGSRAEPHVVDLLALNGNGACSCHDFQSTCWRNIKRRMKLDVDQEISHEEMERHAQYFDLRPIWYGTVKDKNPNRTICRHNQIARQHNSNFLTRELSHGQRSKSGV